MPDKPRAFSDIPGQPGVTYAPAESWWRGPPSVSEETAEEIMHAKALDPANRSMFEQHVFHEIGGTPFKMNPRDAIPYADENLPDLFEKFFQGTVIWEDREKLSTEQRSQWNEVIKNYHAWALEAATAKKKLMTDQYNFSMNQYDNEVKERQAILEKIHERRETMRKQVTKKVWDSESQKYVYRTDEQIKQNPDRYGMTKETAMEMKKAGGVSIQIGVEKFGIQKQATAGNIRTQLMENKRDEKLYESSGRLFNTINVGNEVAYWKSITPGIERQGTRIMKLTPQNIADGWTPKTIQEFADRNGITVEEVLNRIRKK